MQVNLNRVIVITGGSGDIGRSISSFFANVSTVICFTYFSNFMAAKKTEKLTNIAGSEVFMKRVDVASLEKIRIFMLSVIKRYKKIDVLINNAGINRDNFIVRMSDKVWNLVIDVNLGGTFNCTKIVSKFMMRRKYGCIINIGSIVGLTGNLGQINYASSKAGIIGFTKTAAKELSDWNIRVNTVAPGYINAGMAGIIKDTNNFVNILDKIPLYKLGHSNDVSKVVFFLSSKSASYITGQVVNINGGIYM